MIVPHRSRCIFLLLLSGHHWVIHDKLFVSKLFVQPKKYESFEKLWRHAPFLFRQHVLSQTSYALHLCNGANHKVAVHLKIGKFYSLPGISKSLCYRYTAFRIFKIALQPWVILQQAGYEILFFCMQLKQIFALFLNNSPSENRIANNVGIFGFVFVPTQHCESEASGFNRFSATVFCPTARCNLHSASKCPRDWIDIVTLSISASILENILPLRTDLCSFLFSDPRFQRDSLPWYHS